MGRLAVGFSVAVAMLALSGAARADIVVKVDKSSQRMSVIVDGEQPLYLAGLDRRLRHAERNVPAAVTVRYHRSTIYNNAPMPYSIFYDGNFAIHGTTHVSQLGGRASKGCIRLHPSNAAVLFSLVQKQGFGNTRISIQYIRCSRPVMPGQVSTETDTC